MGLRDLSGVLEMVMVIGHRGAAGFEPENTLRSFHKAMDLGCEMIELDVHVSGDGHVVVIHDETVDRTTDGSGKIGEMNLEQIRSLDAGGGEKIPNLKEVMDRFSGRCAINIELKGIGTAAPVAGLLRSGIKKCRWRKEDILISSFSPVELVEFIGLETGIRTAVLVDGIPCGSDEFASEIGAFSVHPNYSFLDGYFVDSCHDSGLLVNVWTVNDETEMKSAIGMGVDGIITDRPDLLVENIKNQCAGDPS
jgi:glycerophosphoryl diester phosphodiesterase